MSDDGRRRAEAQREARIESLGETLALFLRDRKGRAVLEIGCGHGHWLVSLAEADPADACVGIDLLSRRIRLAHEKAARRRLDNLLFLKAEATEVLEAWPRDRPLDRIFLLHPDPWPKKRHAKNRLTGPRFLDGMAAAAAPGAELFFRTDDPDFFEWSKEQISAHSAWREADLPWPHEAASYFRDLLGVHGALTARREAAASSEGSGPDSRKAPGPSADVPPVQATRHPFSP